MITRELENICTYIISKYGASNLEINKYLYMLQAAYMKDHDGKPLFLDDFEAWAYGPVIRNVYDIFKYNGSKKITRENIETIRMLTGFQGNILDINEDIRKFIDNSMLKLSRIQISQIVDYTHASRPWQDSWTNKKEIISKEEIFRYHSENGVKFI